MTAIGISGGFFSLPGGGIGVIAKGPFPVRALVLTARVGDLPVLGLCLAPTGGGFMGQVGGTPRQGDTLYVRYPPEPEIDTGIRYQAPAPLVA